MNLWSFAKYQKNLMYKFQENFWRDRGMGKRTDGKTNQFQFIGPFQPWLAVQGNICLYLPRTKSLYQSITLWMLDKTSATAVDWHLKVLGPTKNSYITVNMQKISSIHIKIQQILGSHEPYGHTHFWPQPPKNHWNNF